MNSFQLALLNLTRRRLSTAIAIASIAISVACGGVLLRLYLLSGSRFSSIARAGEAVVGAKAGGLNILLGALNLEGPYPDFIPLVLYQSLAAKAPVQFADGFHDSPRYIKGAIPIVIFARYKGYRVLGTDEGFWKRPVADDSLSFESGAWPTGEGEVVLGSDVASAEHLKVGDAIVAEQWNGTDEEQVSLSLKVAGVFAPTHSMWDRALYSTLSEARHSFESPQFQQRTPWKSEVLHYYLIYLEPDGFKPLENLVNRRTIAQAIYVPDELDSLRRLTGTGREMGFLMTVLILSLGGLGVASMMVTRFEALTRALAVLRALGFSRSEVTAWLLWEGLLLGLVSCMVGAMIDAAFFPVIRSMLGEALPPPTLVGSPIWASAPVWGMALVATMLSLLIPILRLYSLDVHQSLKGL